MHILWLHRFIILALVSTSIVHPQSPAENKDKKISDWKISRRTIGIGCALVIGSIALRKLYLAWNIIPDIKKVISKPEPTTPSQKTTEKDLNVSTELNPIFKQTILNAARNLDAALLAYVEKQNDSTKKKFEEAFTECTSIINKNTEHKEKILSLIILESNCPLKNLIETAQAAHDNPTITIPRLQEAQKVEHMQKTLQQTLEKKLTEQDIQERTTAFSKLETEFKQKVDAYNQNKSEKNKIEKLTAFYTLQNTMLPLPLERFSSDPIIKITEIELLNLMQENPQLLMQIVSQCPPNAQYLELMASNMSQVFPELESVFEDFNL